MQILNSPNTLLTRYSALRAEAQALDQSEHDANKDKSYVNLTDISETTDRLGTRHSWIRQINSHPELHTKSEQVDPLISRKSEHKNFSITEAETYGLKKTVDGKEVSTGTRKSTTYLDDGTTLRVTESVNSYDQDFFLAGMEQTYLISKASGKVRQLKPKATAAPLG